MLFDNVLIKHLLSVFRRERFFKKFTNTDYVIIPNGSTTTRIDKWGRTRQTITKLTHYGQRKCERWSVNNSRTYCPRRWTRNKYWTREWGKMTTLW